MAGDISEGLKLSRDVAEGMSAMPLAAQIVFGVVFALIVSAVMLLYALPALLAARRRKEEDEPEQQHAPPTNQASIDASAVQRAEETAQRAEEAAQRAEEAFRAEAERMKVALAVIGEVTTTISDFGARMDRSQEQFTELLLQNAQTNRLLGEQNKTLAEQNKLLMRVFERLEVREHEAA